MAAYDRGNDASRNEPRLRECPVREAQVRGRLSPSAWHAAAGLWCPDHLHLLRVLPPRVPRPSRTVLRRRLRPDPESCQVRLVPDHRWQVRVNLRAHRRRSVPAQVRRLERVCDVPPQRAGVLCLRCQHYVQRRSLGARQDSRCLHAIVEEGKNCFACIHAICG